MRLTAGLLSRIAALSLILLLVGMGVFVIQTANSTGDLVAEVDLASESSRAYQDARFRLAQLQVATQAHLYNSKPSSRAEFDAAVDAMLASLVRAEQVGAPADRVAIMDLYTETAPSLEAMKRIFAALEAGKPITDEIPSADLVQRYLDLLEPRAAAYDAAAQKALNDLNERQERTARFTVTVAVGGLIAALFLLLAIRGFGRKAAMHEQEAVYLRSAARQDSLTALGNHRAFGEELHRQLARSARNNEPMALVMLDIDKFKEVNDTLGHAEGDDVLRSVAEVLLRATREDDYCFRIGGDEFAMILPRTSSTDALAIVDRIRTAEHLKLPLGPTLSAGISSADGLGNDGTLIREQADSALYQAKSRGRDTTVVFEPRGIVSLPSPSRGSLAS